LDEDGALYFVAGAHGRTRCVEGKGFLAGRGGHYGMKAPHSPFAKRIWV
jgi:hypothetical protein